MLANSIENEFFYTTLLPVKMNTVTPFENLEDIFSSIEAEVVNTIDDIYVVNNIVLKGSCISSSLISATLLSSNDRDIYLKETNKYSIYKDLKIPFVTRKTFHRTGKESARIFFKALLSQHNEVTICVGDSFSLNSQKGLQSLEDFDSAWDSLARNSRFITLENTQKGDLFKIFAVNGKILGIYGLVPPFIIGDGRSTIEELLNSFILERNKNILYKNYELKNIKKSIDLGKIPNNNEVIRLKDSLKVEFGATYIDITSEVIQKYTSLVEHVTGLLNDKGYVEISCTSPDILSGDNKVTIDSIKKSTADVRHLFSCIYDNEKVNSVAIDLFGTRNLDISLPISFIKPEIYKNEHLKNTSQAYTLKEAAYQLGLKVTELDSNLYQIMDEETQKCVTFLGGMSQYTTVAARNITSDKFLTKKILEKYSINTPKGLLISISNSIKDWEEVNSYFSDVRLVVKPLDMQGGVGVSTDINSKQEFVKAWELCKKLGSKKIVVEEQLEGDDYRIVVVDNVVCGVSQRVSAFVVGDGKRTIKELIDAKNNIRKNNIFFQNTLIIITEQMKVFLEKRNLSINDIPSDGQKVRVSEVANAGAGGDIIDRTNDIHPDWIPLSVRIRKIMANTYHVGLDIMMEDISISPHDQRWAIIEVNTNPDFGVQLFPGEGFPRNVGKIFLESIFGNVSFVKKSCKLTIIGKVQNVGFRNWFKEICDYRSLGGYVKNMESSDRVEALITGPKSVIEDVIKKCYLGPRRAVIESINWEYVNEKQFDNSNEIIIE